MRLFISHLRFALPIFAYDPPGDPQGEAIRVRVPASDPKGIGLVPGMEGDLEFDDGTIRRIKIGNRWSAQHEASELRIQVDPIGRVADSGPIGGPSLPRPNPIPSR